MTIALVVERLLPTVKLVILPAVFDILPSLTAIVLTAKSEVVSPACTV